MVRISIFFILMGFSLSAQTQVELDDADIFLEEASRSQPTSVRRLENKRSRQDKELKIITGEDKEDKSRALDLGSVLEEGFRRNAFENIRKEQRELLNLERQNIWEKFWLPKLSVELQTGDHQIDRLHRSRQSTPSMGAQNAPTGSLGLVFDDYKVFNWGRDYLEYVNEKETVKREDQRLTEARRILKFNLITRYFNLVRLKQIMAIQLEQLRQASFIHRTAREKLQLKKIPVQEYYQTRADFLRAQTQYQQAKFDLGLEEERMANLLNDEFRPSYRPSQNLQYMSLKTSEEVAIEHALRQSIPLRDAKIFYENATRTYEKTLKDNLPLPTLSLNLGAYRSGFDPNGTSWNYQTGPNNRNIELVAGINMSWTIWGDGGFFNNRINKTSYLNKKITEINYYNVKREVSVKVKTIYKTIRFLEQKVSISDFQLKNAQSTYDATLDNYISGKTTYPDIRLALDNYVVSSINFQDAKYDHLLKKLELADLMGLEDFPGENFEQLAVR